MGKFLNASKNQKNFDDRFDTVFHISICHRSNFRFIPIPTTPYMISETSNHGPISYSWVNLKDISASVPLSIVAAEDVNFCNHWGFDLAAIRSAIEQGSKRGASTLSQQVVKNLFLWHQRSWIRKAFEAVLTPV